MAATGRVRASSGRLLDLSDLIFCASCATILEDRAPFVEDRCSFLLCPVTCAVATGSDSSRIQSNEAALCPDCGTTLNPVRQRGGADGTMTLECPYCGWLADPTLSADGSDARKSLLTKLKAADDASAALARSRVQALAALLAREPDLLGVGDSTARPGGLSSLPSTSSPPSLSSPPAGANGGTSTRLAAIAALDRARATQEGAVPRAEATARWIGDSPRSVSAVDDARLARLPPATEALRLLRGDLGPSNTASRTRESSGALDVVEERGSVSSSSSGSSSSGSSSSGSSSSGSSSSGSSSFSAAAPAAGQPLWPHLFAAPDKVCRHCVSKGRPGVLQRFKLEAMVQYAQLLVQRPGTAKAAGELIQRAKRITETHGVRGAVNRLAVFYQKNCLARVVLVAVQEPATVVPAATTTAAATTTEEADTRPASSSRLRRVRLCLSNPDAEVVFVRFLPSPALGDDKDADADADADEGKVEDAVGAAAGSSGVRRWGVVHGSRWIRVEGTEMGEPVEESGADAEARTMVRAEELGGLDPGSAPTDDAPGPRVVRCRSNIVEVECDVEARADADADEGEGADADASSSVVSGLLECFFPASHTASSWRFRRVAEVLPPMRVTFEFQVRV